MTSDMQLKTDVENELRWDPKLNAAQIGITVQNGAVAMSGSVDTYAEKWAAEDAVKRVFGVRTVAQDLTVKVVGEHKHSDAELATATQSALKWDVWVPKTVTATVRDGIVTLSGMASWNYQRDAAVRAIRNLTGVISVNNFIALTPQPGASVAQVQEKVAAALQRQATNDAKSIHIAASGGKVTLSGHASSWASINDASAAAWSAPGVSEVVDNMTTA
jgi:osmotically-inducible protein OsmY